MSRTFLKRVPYRRSVVCPCGQPIGNDRAAKKLRRCTACVARFERSSEIKPPWWQSSLFGSDRRPSRKSAPAAAPAPAVTLAPPPQPAPPKPTAVQLTNDRARRLEGARIRADADARLALYLQLRGGGASREEAEDKVDAAFAIGGKEP